MRLLICTLYGFIFTNIYFPVKHLEAFKVWNYDIHKQKSLLKNDIYSCFESFASESRRTENKRTFEQSDHHAIS